MDTDNIHLSRFIQKQITPFKKQIIFTALIILYKAFFWVYNPYLLKQIIDILAGGPEKSKVWFMLQWPVFLYLSTWLIAITAYRVVEWNDRMIYPQLRSKVMQDMLAHNLLHSHRFSQNNPSGSISNRILDMQNGLAEILNIAKECVFNITLVMTSAGFLFFVHPSITLILFIWLITFISITHHYAPKVRQHAKIFSEEKNSLVGHLVDTIANISTIRTFAQQPYENNKFKQIASHTANTDKALRLTILKMRALWEVTIFAALSGFIYILITLYTQNLATIGDFAFVSSTFIGVIHNIWHLMDQYVRFSEMHGKCIQALDIMSLHEIEDAANAADVLQFNGAITFKNVTFSHTDGEALFSNKSIEIPAKQKVGLVGFSGSGKSTFINLILRLYEIDRGEIMIDQHHIHDVKLASLRAAVSLIPQDPSLLNRSIKENIQYGCFSASDEQIIEASKLAHAHSFISDLPQGYDTVVGEKGAKLSGGQKQRIAIARAILKQAPILILDEATSALDSVTENFIQDSLNLLFKNRTTLVIAHRLSTLSMMDRILVFDKGEIVEDGNHIELLSLGGQYAKMWALQSGGFIQDQ